MAGSLILGRRDMNIRTPFNLALPLARQIVELSQRRPGNTQESRKTANIDVSIT
jgi:hypothetical protein